MFHASPFSKAGALHGCCFRKLKGGGDGGESRVYKTNNYDFQGMKDPEHTTMGEKHKYCHSLSYAIDCTRFCRK